MTIQKNKNSINLQKHLIFCILSVYNLKKEKNNIDLCTFLCYSYFINTRDF
ncbi:conserved hypothetical protein [Treponema phagedenis]|uniref:Uncharacterized protein n=1 Tax=Treponema phagedenis TaxID=162 RepID=A0A0B7GTP6_TREPH|nr:hypothetical protein HMPREF9554_00168 [Treponema phagedenis F0421]CEM60907.1 conserved hypothetical protein [Treponema phagedenis]